MENKLISLSKKELADNIWKNNPRIKILLKEAESLTDARNKLFKHLNMLDRHYFNLKSDRNFKDYHIIERNNAKNCIDTVKNTIRYENEELTGFSALNILHRLAKEDEKAFSEIDKGFLYEFINLFNGINGQSGVTNDMFTLPNDPEEAAAVRMEKLDEYSQRMNVHLKKYKTGTDSDLKTNHEQMKHKILKHFGGSNEDWDDYKWHLKHTIKDAQTLSDLITLEEDEKEALAAAKENDIAFEITPHYLSLINENGRTPHDRANRALVLPGKNYSVSVAENRLMRNDMDFMGEQSTSPIEGITRRYPQIVILKPVSYCPQICVYCQRNWELDPEGNSHLNTKQTEEALDWIRNNPNINEVLVTGGDPFILPDNYLNKLLKGLSEIEHVERIRIGTRTLVTVPQRITENLINILKKYHDLGKREIVVVTHFEHTTEITEDVINAVKKIREAGISIYNQQVFTYYNSKRFETAALKRSLKRSGIDPYYTFNTKGKEETIDFRVPIARILQERKEETRFLPGIVRTDEQVFNVPKLGKSHLNAWQEHEVIMITAKGERMYRFYPWESKVTLVDDYIYTDVSVHDYLLRLHNDGEDTNEYRSIWYYF
jgi:lysine 2,3-aminomutase